MLYRRKRWVAHTLAAVDVLMHDHHFTKVIYIIDAHHAIKRYTLFLNIGWCDI